MEQEEGFETEPDEGAEGWFKTWLHQVENFRRGTPVVKEFDVIQC